MREITGVNANQGLTSFLHNPHWFNNLYYHSVVSYNGVLMKTSGIRSVEVIYELNTKLPTRNSEVVVKGILFFISSVMT